MAGSCAKPVSRPHVQTIYGVAKSMGVAVLLYSRFGEQDRAIHLQRSIGIIPLAVVNSHN